MPAHSLYSQLSIIRCENSEKGSVHTEGKRKRTLSLTFVVGGPITWESLPLNRQTQLKILPFHKLPMHAIKIKSVRMPSNIFCIDYSASFVQPLISQPSQSTPVNHYLLSLCFSLGISQFIANSLLNSIIS